MKKIGIAGTSSSGKTTLCYEILWKLKRVGAFCDGILQQDRRLAFQRELLETDPLAQWAVIMNQIKVEADMALRPGTDILVSDRTPLDFYAYYETMYGRNMELFNLVGQWCATTFERIYVLNPVRYEDNGQRPGEDFRDKVHSILLYICTDLDLPNVILEDIQVDKKLWRQNIPAAILQLTVGKVFDNEDLSMIAETLQRNILIGGTFAFNRQTKWSDLDVYILLHDDGASGVVVLQQKLRSMLGVEVHIHVLDSIRVWAYLRDKQGFKEFRYGDNNGL